ncbi:A/G-specific adenine glycosylase [Ornithinimicrobium sp. F0845]|uniref:A/G-specific adenine glycosylase n=1 Tax=Ornithinimicrobium sp. F0845 TaxID=2926412 RepID=UPI001FF2EB62|nr:A/G-specific adenine glycosylase [Ornithinimicrobium sp. F0845]MCK0113702.1 A/G-specific adenine glycosylase [Ornithinimicrobium sp. F0845]
MDPLLDWFAGHARDLPWRRPDCSPWGVLVSEVMLQQTPVSRVEPVWREWLARWPEPADLAAEAAGEAVRAWGRLGYPRRALRLHACAVALTAEHHGQVPADVGALRALPGIGQYTAAAVGAFAFGLRSAVVDTNVRRVQARAVTGTPLPAPSLTAAEMRLAEQLLPEDPATAARWSIAVMELGALVCTARSPACPRCPLRETCAWVAAGSPAYDGPARRGQAWEGTDRQCRGVIVAALRESADPLTVTDLAARWPDADQFTRALAGLLTDGLAERSADDRIRLPGL